MKISLDSYFVKFYERGEIDDDDSIDRKVSDECVGIAIIEVELA